MSAFLGTFKKGRLRRGQRLRTQINIQVQKVFTLEMQTTQSRGCDSASRESRYVEEETAVFTESTKYLLSKLCVLPVHLLHTPNSINVDSVLELLRREEANDALRTCSAWLHDRL